MKDIIIVLTLLMILFLTVFGIVELVDKNVCTAKTEDIGFSSRWSVLGGCQIEVKEGQWIPLNSYYFKQDGDN